MAESVVGVWAMIQRYVDAVKKKIPNPVTASYDINAAALGDPLIVAKLEFFLKNTLYLVYLVYSFQKLKYNTRQAVVLQGGSLSPRRHHASCT